MGCKNQLTLSYRPGDLRVSWSTSQYETSSLRSLVSGCFTVLPFRLDYPSCLVDARIERTIRTSPSAFPVAVPDLLDMLLWGHIEAFRAIVDMLIVGFPSSSHFRASWDFEIDARLSCCFRVDGALKSELSCSI